MSKGSKLATVTILLALVAATSSQNCIRDEILAVLEELQNGTPPAQGIPVSLNQSASITCAQVEELNNTMQ